MMQDITEANLEQLIKKQRNIVESKISSLNPTEISIASNKIPSTRTMLEHREFRSSFIRKFASPLEFPKCVTYSDELLSSPKKNIEFSSDSRQFLLNYFKQEIERVKEIRNIVSSRISTPELAFQNQSSYPVFMDAISHHFSICEEGLARLSAATLMTFTANDLFLELKSHFLKKKRNAMINAYLNTISHFPMTSRQQIFQILFNYTNKLFVKDTSQIPIPLQIVDEEPLDVELRRLAKRFNLHADLETDDGQKFVYYANKTLESLWPLLNTFDFPKKQVQIPEYPIHPSLTELTQRSFISQAPRDFRLQTILNQLASLRDDEVSVSIREVSQYYNTSVGNQVRGQSINYEKNKKLLPLHKISAWLELRFIHMKFLACSILSILNYFEFVRYRLSCCKHFAVLKYKISNSPSLTSLIEIVDENNSPFIFESALQVYEGLKDSMIAIGSYHLSKIESEQQMTEEGEPAPDRESILEKILQYEFSFLNSKRKLVQALLEALNHSYKEDKLSIKIYEIIDEPAILNLPLFKSFEAPFESAIELMEKRANILRFIVNNQILHERQVSLQMPDYLDIFDRPQCLSAEEYRVFDESVPISPFEVYPSLTKIYKFLDIIPKVVNDIGESADLRMTKFGNYLEIAVITVIENLLTNTIQNGYFPFDRPSENFRFLLSDSVNSLFTSPFVNSFSSLISFMTNMNEGRKLRFLLSARKFAKISWKLQKMIITTNHLQTAYFEQCDIIGIGERSVLLSSFKENAKKEMIDIIQSTSSNDKIIDFAMTEFEAMSINFSSPSAVKDIVIVGNYDKLNEILRFQQLQNVILEVAVRYNSHILDSNYFIEFFNLDERSLKENNKENKENNNSLFLTSTNEAEKDKNDNFNENENENENSNQNQNQSFFKQFLAAQMFTLSTSLYRDNQIAYEDKGAFSVPIQAIKSRARSFLAGQYKAKEMTHDELLEFYINEMLDSFSCFMYRSELAHVTNLERQILLSNSFIDTFIIGPDPTTCLINEAGRFEKFFYVPTWVECFRMMQSAPQQRQSIVLKPTLHFVVSRFRVLSMIRFESSLLMKANQVFDSLYERQFLLESPVFQRLFNEFGRLPSAREIDISANYFLDKETFYFYRFEKAIFLSFESFFVSLNAESKRISPPVVVTTTSTSSSSGGNNNNGGGGATGSKTTSGKVGGGNNEKNVKTRIGGVTDFRFGDTIKHFWNQMHDPLDTKLMTIRRYIPLYQDEYLFNLNESDRNEIINSFVTTDTLIEDAIQGLRNNSFMDIFQILPSLLDFLKSSCAMHQMKYALFLLLKRINESDINLTSSVQLINQEIFIQGTPIWNDLIVAEANSALIPRDEPLHNLQDGPPETKIQEAYFDQMKIQIDLLLLSNQIKSIQSSINKFSGDFSTLHEKSALAFKPDFMVNDNILNAPPVNADSIFVIQPNEADRQFFQEHLYSHAKFVNFVANSLDSCTLERRDHDGTFSTIFDGDGFEESCYKLTTALNIFSKGSLADLNLTWRQYIATIASQLRKNTEMMKIMSFLTEFVHKRFDCHTQSEKSWKFSEQIYQLNSLHDILHKLLQTRQQRDNEIASDLKEYFEKLLIDISTEIISKKSMFSGIKQNVYEHVINKINFAKKVKLEVKSSKSDQNNINENIENENENENKNLEILSKIKVENDQTLKKILVLRVLRCLSEISVTRYFKKRLSIVENDRKQANASLWSNKLSYETQEVSMKRQLDESRQRLTETEIEIEKLKQQLENEKLSNIQLVHWKAKNLKTIDSLKIKIDALKNINNSNSSGCGDNINIDELLLNLETKHLELDKLREEAEILEKNIQEVVKVPMKSIEKLRENMSKTRQEKSELIMEMQPNVDFDQRMERELNYQAVIDDNVQLKHSNELLRAQIMEIEARKEKKAFDVKNFMERTTQPPPPTIRSVAKMPGIIIKPSVMGRSLSRI